MIVIIIKLLQPLLHSPTFLQNFTNKDNYSMNIVVREEQLLRYLSNLTVNGHPKKLGDDFTNVVASNGAHFNISRPNMPINPPPKEGLISHYQILLEESPEECKKEMRDREGQLLTDPTCRDNHQYLLTTWMINHKLTNASNLINLSLKDSFYLKMWSGATFNVAMIFLHECPW